MPRPVRSRRISRGTAIAAGVLLASTMVCDAKADTSFYARKTLNILVGVNVGAAYDLQARLIGRHMKEQLPGLNAVIVQNMIGAGGLKMANFLYNMAPQDGTYLGMLGNTLVASQAVGAPGIMFDAGKFNWIGAISPIVLTMATWHDRGAGDFAAARTTETIAAASARGAITYTFPMMMNVLLGTKFRIVTGYKGLSDMSLALERGEAEAVASSWSGWKTTKREWLRDRKLRILVQTEPKSAELPGVPSVEELAANEDDRQVIELIVSGARLGFPLVAAPGAPRDRVELLRNGFASIMRSGPFRREAEAMALEIDPISGASLQQTVARILATPKHLVERAKPIIAK